ncbi:DUF1488 family protein [Paraburkholderia fungorum]|uniref:DUF1488 family protein n=1 Tax=Paraburkholderia fungorum TaxID=134537 RepID=UPI001C1EBC1B|nr:DUF1488 family protein [Paraburkholderia fungorum]MBU7443503.1 DUF1488 domain-containing protein [Paraburkholderia fungorum]
MESTLTPEVGVSSDGKLIAFVVHIRGQNVPCSITRSALEAYFLVPAGASDARILKAIADGRNRISAAVERKLLRAPGEPVRLVDADFNH